MAKFTKAKLNEIRGLAPCIALLAVPTGLETGKEIQELCDELERMQDARDTWEAAARDASRKYHDCLSHLDNAISAEELACEKTRRIEAEGKTRRLEIVYKAATEVVDALSLRGHPMEEAWDTLVLHTGRYCSPYLGAPDDFDSLTKLHAAARERDELKVKVRELEDQIIKLSGFAEIDGDVGFLEARMLQLKTRVKDAEDFRDNMVSVLDDKGAPRGMTFEGLAEWAAERLVLDDDDGVSCSSLQKEVDRLNARLLEIHRECGLSVRHAGAPSVLSPIDVIRTLRRRIDELIEKGGYPRGQMNLSEDPRILKLMKALRGGDYGGREGDLLVELGLWCKASDRRALHCRNCDRNVKGERCPYVSSTLVDCDEYVHHCRLPREKWKREKPWTDEELQEECEAMKKERYFHTRRADQGWDQLGDANRLIDEMRTREEAIRKWRSKWRESKPTGAKSIFRQWKGDGNAFEELDNILNEDPTDKVDGGDGYAAEVSRATFTEMIKRKGVVRASLSHSQEYPDAISQFAILDWQYDGELFAVTSMGRRVVANHRMPAFRPYVRPIVEPDKCVYGGYAMEQLRELTKQVQSSSQGGHESSVIIYDLVKGLESARERLALLEVENKGLALKVEREAEMTEGFKE